MFESRVIPLESKLPACFLCSISLFGTLKVNKTCEQNDKNVFTVWFPGKDTEPEASPADMADLSTTPPRILHLHPSIQFIAIPDTPGYPIQTLQTLRLSPPVIRLPIPNTAATPTYILGELSIHMQSFL